MRAAEEESEEDAAPIMAMKEAMVKAMKSAKGKGAKKTAPAMKGKRVKTKQ